MRHPEIKVTHHALERFHERASFGTLEKVVHLEEKAGVQEVFKNSTEVVPDKKFNTYHIRTHGDESDFYYSEKDDLIFVLRRNQATHKPLVTVLSTREDDHMYVEDGILHKSGVYYIPLDY